MFRPFSYPYNQGRRQPSGNNRNQGSQMANGAMEHRQGIISNHQYNPSPASASQTYETLPAFNGSNINLSDPVIVEFLKQNPKTGYLKLKVSTGRGAVPIYSANITIFKQNDDTRYNIASETTDLNGLTIPIPLPAPDKSQTFNPQNPRPYASYNILVQHPEYKEVLLENIPIFDGITSVQNVNMLAQKEQTPPQTINESGTAPKE